MDKNEIQEKINEIQATTIQWDKYRNNILNKMDKKETQEKINEIQTTFGMTNTRLAEILGMPLNTLKQKKYNEKYRYFPEDLKKLKEFVKSSYERM